MFSADQPGSGLEGAEFTAALVKVAMFPLREVVLLPNALLPLHIFEPRYKKMTRDLLAGNRLLVMGLQRGAEEPHSPPPPVAPIAGVGEIILAHELPDGRFNIVLRGRARVRIETELPSDEPYRLVSCVEVPDDPVRNPREVTEADASLRALVQGLAEALPAGGELLKQIVASQEEPAPLADVLAATLLGEVADRQAMLEETDVLRRLDRMAQEVAAMTGRLMPRERAH